MLRDWVQLSLTRGLGPITIQRLVAATGSARAACCASDADLRRIDGIESLRSAGLSRAIAAAAGEADAEIARVRDLGLALIDFDDPAYPPALKAIPDPPPVLYSMGTLEPRDLNAVAIVGSRKCSIYGREQADRFAALLAGAGFTVISGGARGVDSAAHRGALQHPQGRSIAVVGTGLDRVYPPENEDLFKVIAARGAILSEFPLGTPPLADNFPRRNRVVSGMSRGVLVIEAGQRSGALITARLANEDQGRPVFAVPGRVDNALSAGPHQLIRDGAILATGLEDILEGLGPLPQNAIEPSLFDMTSPATDDTTPAGAPERAAPNAPAAAPLLSERQRRIAGVLTSEPLGVDQIIDRTGLDAAGVLQELTVLSLRGMARRVDGQKFARGK